MICRRAICLVALLACWWQALAQAAIVESNRFAWSESAGWLNWRATNEAGVVFSTITVTRAFTNYWLEGEVWQEQTGWLRLGTTNGPGPYGNTAATNWGVNLDANGDCHGYAWSENTGWINFGSPSGGVTLDFSTGFLDGYAWSEGVGWISMCGIAQNADPYGVQVERKAPSAGPATVWRATNNLALKIPDFMLLTNTVDPESSALSVYWASPVSTNDGAVRVSGHWTLYTPPAGNDAADYFQFRVRNAFGWTAENTAEVLVFIPQPTGQTFNVSSLAPTASNTLVRFVGIPGRNYEVQSTTNLVSTPWHKIGEVTIGGMGYVIFTDTNEPSGQFYRTARPE